MVLFNYSTKEITAKIVYYGPGLCGKTTNLQFIYENLPQAINKGKMLSLATKTDRTLFFDFLPIDLGTIRGMRTRLQLYTVPGQVFYNTTRKLVLKGADGVVFVADSQKRMIEANIESFKNLEENLAEHDINLSEMPIIIQFNKRDLPDVAGIEELNTALNRFNAPIYEAVATTGIGVHETLKAITRLVLNSLKERYADKREQRAEPPPDVAAMAASAAARTASAASTPAPPRAVAVNAPSTPLMPSRAPAPPTPPAAPLKAASLPPAAEPRAPLDLGPPFPTGGSALDFPLPDLEDGGEFEEMEGSQEMEASRSIDESGSLEMEIAPIEEPVRPFARSPAAIPSTPFPPARSVLPEEPLELMADSGLEAGNILDVMPAEGPGGELPAATEDILELVEEAPSAPFPWEHEQEREERSREAGPPEITEEIFQMEEPSFPEAALEDTYEPIPVAQEVGDSGRYELVPTDLIEPSDPTDALESSPFAPVEAMVFEDRHDDELLLGGLTHDAPVVRISVEEIPVSPADRDVRGAPTQRPAGPPAPITQRHGTQPAVREVTALPVAAGEIHLPIRLQIGGQVISFELKVSLDLPAHSPGSRGTSSEKGEELS
jgi:hypothetical protein